jgi:predicted secreted Zn-dependent protease
MNAQLTITPLPDMPVLVREPAWDEWRAYGAQLKQHETRLGEHVKNFRFVVAKWYEYGVEHWHRPAEKIAREIGFDPETIQNWAWTARHTEALRASPHGDELSYEHYRALAAVKDTGKQSELAARVKTENLSGGQLRREIQRANGKHVAPATQAAHDEAHDDKIKQLIQTFCDEGVALMAKGDPISQAQADVKLDCAARLREIAD